jgi:hypothetical protein
MLVQAINIRTIARNDGIRITYNLRILVDHKKISKIRVFCGSIYSQLNESGDLLMRRKPTPGRERI